MKDFKLSILILLSTFLVSIANGNSFVLVDDFESYTTDVELKEIWAEGGMASVLLSTDEDYRGRKSMQISYSNVSGSYSEAIRDYNGVSQNWAVSDLNSLSFWFMGQEPGDPPPPPENDPDWIYVALTDDDTPSHTAIVTHPDINAIKLDQWQQWEISLSEFKSPAQPAANDVNLANIMKIAIGVGDRGGSPSGSQGSVYIDQIWLHPTKGPNEPNVNVKTDLVGLGYPYGNAVGDGATNDNEAIQFALDYVSWYGSGTVYCPPSTYRVERLFIFEGVNLVGAGKDQTVFRPHPDHTQSYLLDIEGGSMRDFTAFGTFPEDSGENWVFGGHDGCRHLILADGITSKTLIKNVRALEVRQFNLYSRNCSGLWVVDSEFDRADTIIAIDPKNQTGINEDFVFANCKFGPYRNSYLFDIEPTDQESVRNGVILNCEFNGTDSGAYGTKTNCWGCFLGLKGTDSSPYYRKNVATLGCDFNDVYIFVNKVFDNAQFIDNTMDSPSGYDIFRKYEDAAVGELKDARIVCNEFVGASSWDDVIQDVNFPGDSFFACNKPLWANDSGYSWHEPNYSDLALLHSVSNLEDLSFSQLMRLVNNCPRELIDYNPSISWNPNPGNRVCDVDTNAVLSWSAGDKAVSHDVYIGTDFNDVNDASIELLAADVDSNRKVGWADVSILVEQWLTSPGGLQPSGDLDGDGDVNLIDFAVLANYWMQRVEGNQDANSYIPDGLESDTIYYWRIDEVHAPNTYKGDVWSFYTAVDTNAPTPSPMDWDTVPYQAGPYSIDMIANEASDFSGVEYYFENQDIADHNSGWQDCRFWEDEGLEPETPYCYKVKARDKSNNQNQTTWSSQECATTAAECGSAPMYRGDSAVNQPVTESFGNALLGLLPSIAAIGIWGIYKRKRLKSPEWVYYQMRITQKNER